MKSNVGHQLSALLSGLVFGAGLVISGMTQPQKVLGFLDPLGRFDASLILVMIASLVDGREQDEYRGELGHIPGSILVPLSTLGAAASDWPKERAVVLICRSGGRSAQATMQLVAAGFKRIASLHGGMIDWNAKRLSIERGYIETRQG